MENDVSTREPASREDGTAARGDAIRTTIGTILAAVLGLVTTFGVSGLGPDVYDSTLTWVIIIWTLIGMAVAGLWPLIRGVRRSGRRTGLALATFGGLAVASAGVVLLDRPGDGTDPVHHGCRHLNGQYQTVASTTIYRSWGVIGTMALVRSVSPKCGLVWAEFLTPRGRNGVRPSFISRKITAISIDVRRGSSSRLQRDQWDYDAANATEKHYRDLWTPALRLEDGVYEANISISFSDGGSASERLVWNTDKSSVKATAA